MDNGHKGKNSIKGILKRPSESIDQHLHEVNHPGMSHFEATGGVKFNEDEIQLFTSSNLREYDKHRGQKMKVDEPKTPWHENVEDNVEYC